MIDRDVASTHYLQQAAMSEHSHTHAPGESHSHSHAPPQQQQAQVPPPPDPALQAIIDQDFKPVDIALSPDTHVALCAKHSLEKCTDCDIDFINLNRLSRILAANPNLLCPPPANVVSQKLTQAVTATKDEGNVSAHTPVDLVSLNSFRPCIKWGSIPKPLDVTTWQLQSPFSVLHGKPVSSCAKNSLPSYPTAPPHTTSHRTTYLR